MSELTGMEAQTVHRMLGMSWNDVTHQVTFQKTEKEPLEADAVIVDETSMVDVPLMAALLSAMQGDCRLVLVGDPDQLPSVGPGNLFGDLIRSGTVPTVRLTQIFRQAAQSAIVRNAHLVNAGELPDLRKNQDRADSACGTGRETLCRDKQADKGRGNGLRGQRPRRSPGSGYRYSRRKRRGYPFQEGTDTQKSARR